MKSLTPKFAEEAKVRGMSITERQWVTTQVLEKEV